MYVYGYFKCNAPVVYERELISWSTPYPINQVTYLMSENIINSIPLKDFVNRNDITEADYLAVMLQLFNALNVAYKTYLFTHHDLHSSNVLVRILPEPVIVAFRDGYIVTRYIPFIIDYSYSSITIDDVEYGRKGMHPFPMSDIYKLLCFSTQSLIGRPEYQPKQNLADQMFQFFHEGSIKERISARLDTPYIDFYKLNANNVSPTITHENFINLLLTKSGIAFPIEYFNPNYSTITPISTFEFIKLVQKEDISLTAADYCVTTNNAFDADAYYINTYPKIIEKIVKANHHLDDINTPDKNKTRKSINMAYAKDIIYDLIRTINYIKCSLQKQQILKYSTEIPELNNLINRYNMLIDTYWNKRDKQIHSWLTPI